MLQAALVEAMESKADLIAADQSESDAQSADRLVIRIVLPKDSLQAPVRRGMSKGVLLPLAVCAAVLLTWIGLSMFRTEPASTAAVTAPAPRVESAPPAPASTEAARVDNSETPSQPTSAETAPDEIAPRASDAQPVEPQTPAQPDAPPAPIDAVIPDVPRSALNTIRGTVRVSVRAIIDKEGAVVAVATDDPGPSRYFERLALEASRKWTFTPAATEEQRVMLVKFNFTRAGATARANPVLP